MQYLLKMRENVGLEWANSGFINKINNWRFTLLRETFVNFLDQLLRMEEYGDELTQMRILLGVNCFRNMASKMHLRIIMYQFYH